jgi:hypothetical protein
MENCAKCQEKIQQFWMNSPQGIHKVNWDPNSMPSGDIKANVSKETVPFQGFCGKEQRKRQQLSVAPEAGQ